MNLNAFGEGLVTIALAIVGLGIISVLVSKKAQTGAVAQSIAGGFGEDIAAAEGPVTGQAFHASFPTGFGQVDLSNMLST